MRVRIFDLFAAAETPRSFSEGRGLVEARGARLAVHHHGVYFLGSSGDVHLPSFIGPWLESLCRHWREIVYLGYESTILRPDQDVVVNAQNLRVHSLGLPGRELDLPMRIRRVRRRIAEAERLWDMLLVRGPTPRQGTVLRADSCGRQAMLLVGDPPVESWKVRLREGLEPLYLEMLVRRRRAQTEYLGKSRLVMANSLALCEAWGRKLGKTIPHVPTTSLGEGKGHTAEDRFTTSPHRLLFVGRVCVAKGVDDLLRAVTLLKAGGPPVTLNVVGDAGEGESIASFKKLAEDLGVSALVTWHGKLPYGEQVFKLFREADALVLPSRHEGFPRVLWEAFAHSVPVIVTPVGGIPHLCRDREEVLFVKPENPGDIAFAVNLLSGSQLLRMRLIRNGRALQELNTSESCAQRLTSCLERELLRV